MSEMTMRERMLALVEGREHDRVPFVEYSGIAGASNEEVWSVIGRDNMGLLAWCGLHRFEHPNCHFEQEELEINGRRGTRRILHTPEGKLTDERLNAAIASSSYKHFITEPEDYKAFLSYLRDTTVHKSTDQWLNVYNSLGVLHRKKGDLDTALKNYIKAIKVHPGEPYIHYNIGRLYLEKKEIADARDHFKKAIDINPEFTEAKEVLKAIELGTIS